MPRTSTDYSKTIIYKIVCNDLNVKDCYVGHTTDFSSRKRKHKYKTLNPNLPKHDAKVYKCIRENGGWDNWSMIEIEKVNCADSLEAQKQERYWIETLKSNLNYQIPTRTQKEYYEICSDKILEWRHTKCKCECGGKYTNESKARHLKSKKHQEYLSQHNIT